MCATAKKICCYGRILVCIKLLNFEFEIKCLGHQLSIDTPVDYRYQYMWKSVERRSFLSFKVRACNDVHVALAEEMGRTDTSMYEIVIGGWENTR